MIESIYIAILVSILMALAIFGTALVVKIIIILWIKDEALSSVVLALFTVAVLLALVGSKIFEWI